MIFLKKVVDKPRSPLGHVYFSLSEISSNESVDIRLEKDESIKRGTCLLVDIPSSIFCHLPLNLLDDTLRMFKYIHTYESLKSLSPMTLLYYY
jgi:hypothetical protein